MIKSPVDWKKAVRVSLYLDPNTHLAATVAAKTAGKGLTGYLAEMIQTAHRPARRRSPRLPANA